MESENASRLLGFLVVVDHHDVIHGNRLELLDLVPDVLGVRNGLVPAVLTPDDGVVNLALAAGRISLQLLADLVGDREDDRPASTMQSTRNAAARS